MTKAETTPMKLTLDSALRQRLTTAPQQAINDIKRQLTALLMAKADDKGNSSEWAICDETEEQRLYDPDCPWPFNAGHPGAAYLPNTTPIQRRALHKSAQIYFWNVLYNTFKDIEGIQYILTDTNYQCVNYGRRDEMTGEPTPIGTLLWLAIEQHYMSKDSFETLNYVRDYRKMLQSVEALKSFNSQHVEKFNAWIHQCTMTENIVKDLPDDIRCNSANFNDLKSHLTTLHTSMANKQGINFDYGAIYDDPRFNTEGGPDYMNIAAMLSELRSVIRKHAASTTDSCMKSVQVMNTTSPDTCDYCGGKGHTRSNCKKHKAYKEALHVRKLHHRSGPSDFKRSYNKPQYNKFTFKRQQPNQLGNFLKPLTKFQGKSPRFPNKLNKPYTEPYNKSAHYHQRRGTPPPYQPRRVHFADQKRVPAFIAAPPRPLPRDPPPPSTGPERAGFEAPSLPTNDNLLTGAATKHFVLRVGVVDHAPDKTQLAPIGTQPAPSTKGINPVPTADCDPIEHDDNELPPKKRPRYMPIDCTHLPDGTAYVYIVNDPVEDPYKNGKKPTSGYDADDDNWNLPKVEDMHEVTPAILLNDKRPEAFTPTGFNNDEVSPFTPDDEHDDRHPEHEVLGDPSTSDDDFDSDKNDKGNDDSTVDSAADDHDSDPDDNNDDAGFLREDSEDDDSSEADGDDDNDGNDSGDLYANDSSDANDGGDDDRALSAKTVDTINIDDDIFESAKLSHKICATANYISDLEERNKVLEAEVNDHRELLTMFDSINQDAHKYILSLKTDVKQLEQNKIDLAADLASYQAEVRRLESCLIDNNLQHLISGASPSDSESNPATAAFYKRILSNARTDPTITVAADASLSSPSDDNISASDNSDKCSSAKSLSSDYDSSGSL